MLRRVVLLALFVLAFVGDRAPAESAWGVQPTPNVFRLPAPTGGVRPTKNVFQIMRDANRRAPVQPTYNLVPPTLWMWPTIGIGLPASYGMPFAFGGGGAGGGFSSSPGYGAMPTPGVSLMPSLWLGGLMPFPGLGGMPPFAGGAGPSPFYGGFPPGPSTGGTPTTPGGTSPAPGGSASTPRAGGGATSGGPSTTGGTTAPGAYSFLPPGFGLVPTPYGYAVVPPADGTRPAPNVHRLPPPSGGVRPTPNVFRLPTPRAGETRPAPKDFSPPPSVHGATPVLPVVFVPVLATPPGPVPTPAPKADGGRLAEPKSPQYCVGPLGDFKISLRPSSNAAGRPTGKYDVVVDTISRRTTWQLSAEIELSRDRKWRRQGLPARSGRELVVLGPFDRGELADSKEVRLWIYDRFTDRRASLMTCAIPSSDPVLLRDRLHLYGRPGWQPTPPRPRVGTQPTFPPVVSRPKTH